MADTNIPVSEEVWHALNSRKEGIGDTFDAVLRRELDLKPEAEPEDQQTA